MKTSELTTPLKTAKTRLINTRLLEEVEKLRSDGARKSEGKSKSNPICYNAGLFIGGKKRGDIHFTIKPPDYHATLVPMVGFVHLDGPAQSELVRQIMDWFKREYVGAVDLEFKPDRKTSLCQKLNREMRSFSADNRRNKVAPAGRTLSRAFMPHNQGKNRHA